MIRYEFQYGDDSGIIELDERVVERAPDWGGEESLVEHIAWNMVANDLELHSLDGFADLPDEYAVLVERPRHPAVWDVERKP